MCAFLNPRTEMKPKQKIQRQNKILNILLFHFHVGFSTMIPASFCFACQISIVWRLWTIKKIQLKPKRIQMSFWMPKHLIVENKEWILRIESNNKSWNYNRLTNTKKKKMEIYSFLNDEINARVCVCAQCTKCNFVFLRSPHSFSIVWAVSHISYAKMTLTISL